MTDLAVQKGWGEVEDLVDFSEGSMSILVIYSHHFSEVGWDDEVDVDDDLRSVLISRSSSRYLSRMLSVGVVEKSHTRKRSTVIPAIVLDERQRSVPLVMEMDRCEPVSRRCSV
jgi:hypothetical protein